ncbi:NAD(P)/FAD-dependent oxidoreductase [Flaviaesturariibacter aridisoli]|uniref:FAD-binding protein n=1 Tax=Flaviaesturariibacter aridisoli TaxID=2545761 RepID=A0A4R4E7C4_9BACT|nr:FAD-dependent monooxygenase [Flaviaesturariibacter aridisoli]TCZ74987.1 FAD-binding protein [Flaviaesturariibacter aridisoli]
MSNETRYDAAIIGGGLAGLSAGIGLARAGHSVILFEKGHYPAHRVCGEYVSFESWSYLQHLGLPLETWDLPEIHRLRLTAPDGRAFEARLPLGGFGISRYKLDAALASCARAAAVTVVEGARVTAVDGTEPFRITVEIRDGATRVIEARACCGAWGKRANLDVGWGRAFLQRTDRRLDNFVAVKYHLQSNWPAHSIGLHNFPGGYCGISGVEEGRTSLCYLVRAEALRACGGKLARLEAEVLGTNPHLRRIFSESSVLEPFPLTISQISFQTKAAVERGVLLLGDAAGMISPLCGNGMSIALHTGKLAAGLTAAFLEGTCSRREMEDAYAKGWRTHFSGRLGRGRLLQRFFGSRRASIAFVRLFCAFPALAKPVIRSTHGEIF